MDLAASSISIVSIKTSLKLEYFLSCSRVYHVIRCAIYNKIFKFHNNIEILSAAQRFYLFFLAITSPKPGKVNLLFIVAATAAIVVFYYKGLNLLSPRRGCLIFSFLAFNYILPAKRVKEIANQPNDPC